MNLNNTTESLLVAVSILGMITSVALVLVKLGVFQ